MLQYRCKKCGYIGKKLIFQFDDFGYCVATNKLESEYIEKPPKWVIDKGFGEAEIGEPVGCPKCYVWGVDNFETIE